MTLLPTELPAPNRPGFALGPKQTQGAEIRFADVCADRPGTLLPLGSMIGVPTTDSGKTHKHAIEACVLKGGIVGAAGTLLLGDASSRRAGLSDRIGALSRIGGGKIGR
jgi:hypothetical protein